LRFSGPKTSIICSPMTSLKTSIKTITYLSDIGCLEIHGASLLTPVGNFNAQVLGGVTYYTHYYRVNFPRQFPNAQIATLATLASSEFSKQTTMAGKSLATHRDTDSGTDVSRTRFTVAYTTPNLGETPTLHFEAIGY
ncbi:hypothetical protein JZM12_26900, partial [Escherichia coli]|nr:hypothetical protein [Escherichia coli]